MNTVDCTVCLENQKAVAKLARKLGFAHPVFKAFHEAALAHWLLSHHTVRPNPEV